MRRSYIWATAITVGLGLWMASPYLMPSLMGAAPPEEASTAGAAVAEKLFKVRVKAFTAIPRVAVVTANGVTAASKRVDARARTNGTIMESLFSQGQSVKAGDVLCELDMASREADLAQAKASLASAQRDFEATEKLANSSYATTSKLWSDKARLDAAQATLTGIETDVGYLEIKAPVDGVLIEKPAEAGSLLQLAAFAPPSASLIPCWLWCKSARVTFPMLLKA